MQLQIPLVLLRQVQTVPQDGGDAHVSVMLSSKPLLLRSPPLNLMEKVPFSFFDSKQNKKTNKKKKGQKGKIEIHRFIQL